MPQRNICRIFITLLAFAWATVVTLVLLHLDLVKLDTELWNQNLFQQAQSGLDNSQQFRFDVAVWHDVDTSIFDNVLDYPKFPHYPDQTYTTNDLAESVQSLLADTPYMMQIRTYITPNESGFYLFRVTNPRARIFLEMSWGEIRAILKSKKYHNKAVDGDFYNFHDSEAQLLHSKRTYYFELQLFSGSAPDNFTMQWIVPGATEFQSIWSSSFTYPAVPPRAYPRVPDGHMLSPEAYYLLGFIPRTHVTRSFLECSSDIYHKMKHESFDQATAVFVPPENPPTDIQAGVQAVVSKLNEANPKRYPFFKIRKIESNRLPGISKEFCRLLIDLEFYVDGLDYKQRLSEYFLAQYHDTNNASLCRPVSWDWKRLQTLYFVFIEDCAKNESIWTEYFIKNMASLLRASLDINFKILVTTCDEGRVKVYDSLLLFAGFDARVVALLEGTFSKSRALKAVLRLVQEKNSIVVLCGPRLYMPTGIFEEIRKHTFEKTMAYSPTPFQLEDGSYPGIGQPQGNWCQSCVGLVAIHTKDMKRLVKNSWLTYDAEQRDSSFAEKASILQKISNLGIELTRPILPGFYRLHDIRASNAMKPALGIVNPG